MTYIKRTFTLSLIDDINLNNICQTLDAIPHVLLPRRDENEKSYSSMVKEILKTFTEIFTILFESEANNNSEVTIRRNGIYALFRIELYLTIANDIKRIIAYKTYYKAEDESNEEERMIKRVFRFTSRPRTLLAY